MKWLSKEILKQDLNKGMTNPSFNYAHLTTIQEASVLFSTLQQQKQIVVIKENETQARALFDQMESLFPQIKTQLYYQEDSLRVEAIASSPENHYEKMEALYHILYKEPQLIITTSASMMRYVADPKLLVDRVLNLRINQEIEMNDLVNALILMGYQQAQVVEKPFTFARRGGIIDVFTIQHQYPIRIDFFDNVIESMRLFDVESQRSISDINEVLVFVASEYLTTDEQKALIIKKSQERLLVLKENLDADSYDILYENVYKDVDQFTLNDIDARFYSLFALSEPSHQIIDYCKDAKVILSPETAVKKSAKFFIDESIDYLNEHHQGLKGLDRYDIFCDIETLNKKEYINFHQFQADNEVEVDIHDLFNPPLEFNQLLTHIQNQAIEQRVILSVSVNQIQRLITLLDKTPYQLIQDELPKESGIYITNHPLRSGFFINQSQIVVYSSKELFNQVIKKGRYERQFQVAQSLSGIADLKKGDYVVHRQYGVGQYLGLETKEVNHRHKDFIHIAYRNDDVLLVPLEQFKLLRKFVSSEGISVKLNKLGGSDWNKTKNRIKESVNDIADQLIELYQERQAKQGFQFSPDNDYMKQFEEEFPYQLTRDQEKAIKEVKEDMESLHPMDRLLSGDVGFGKTEVAIRAAFKAIIDNKQVVFLCPTTVLSQQHYRTFSERFKNYPVNIGLLNRFVSPEKQRETIQKVKDGHIDILIGTHRVLSNDIHFKDLGLLVIDEEQRFGVQQKEKIKTIKVNIDVLSLSATPIPRTLQMSLVGIRSLSQLNTPPSNRLPVVTRIVEKNPKLIEELIEREIARKGQVFYLYNRVDQIYNVAFKIQEKFPHIVVACAHGQMNRDEIEDVMMAFTRGEIQVLVCTTIVETGIDIPNANTMIIDQADRFGLAQLYQIKGRVGRSDTLAYAYLMIDPQKQLSEIATKRLEAIKEFTQLGSGYKIAMRDLTIRGAGEILGGNQSGFIDTVGIDLYIELLNEAILEKQGQKPPQQPQPLHLNDVETYIPKDYTSDESLKIELYQKIDKITSMAQLDSFYQESQDRYGSFPNSVNLLLEKKQLELMLADERIEDFKERNDTATIIFTKAYSDTIDGVKFFESVNQVSKEIGLKYLKGQIRLEIDKNKGWLSEIVKVLNAIKGANHAHR